jgi:hypothetical protein
MLAGGVAPLGHACERRRTNWVIVPSLVERCESRASNSAAMSKSIGTFRFDDTIGPRFHWPCTDETDGNARFGRLTADGRQEVVGMWSFVALGLPVPFWKTVHKCTAPD